MLLLEGYISNFTCASYSFLYVEFSDFYVNQSLAGQTIPLLSDMFSCKNIFRTLSFFFFFLFLISF
jgi:hypothetical protein